jgi:hypothetical protein
MIAEQERIKQLEQEIQQIKIKTLNKESYKASALVDFLRDKYIGRYALVDEYGNRARIFRIESIQHSKHNAGINVSFITNTVYEVVTLDRTITVSASAPGVYCGGVKFIHKGAQFDIIVASARKYHQNNVATGTFLSGTNMDELLRNTMMSKKIRLISQDLYEEIAELSDRHAREWSDMWTANKQPRDKAELLSFEGWDKVLNAE